MVYSDHRHHCHPRTDPPRVRLLRLLTRLLHRLDGRCDGELIFVSRDKRYLTVFRKIWSFCAGFCCIILPIYESRSALKHVVLGLVALARGKNITPIKPGK